MEDIGAVYLHMDNGKWGCENSHRRTWDWMSNNPGNAEWQVVVEDDCIPCEGFAQQLEAALAASPCDVVSLYLGTSTPAHWQARIQAAIQHHPDAHWYLNNAVISAVGIAIRTQLLPLKLDTNMPIDQAIGNWCRTNKHKTAFTNPSLLQHRDEQPVIRQRYDGVKRTQPRKAWAWGTRERWTSKAAQL